MWFLQLGAEGAYHPRELKQAVQSKRPGLGTAGCAELSGGHNRGFGTRGKRRCGIQARRGHQGMNYAGKAERLLLGGQGQTEVPYSTGEQRLAAAQVLALLILAEAIKDLSASIDLELRGDGGNGIGKAIEYALGMAYEHNQPGPLQAVERLSSAVYAKR